MPHPGESNASAAATFVDKWSRTTLTERAASHEHFLDLCRLLGVETPATADGAGEDYCFEKNVVPIAAASKGSKGETGFVDVWKRGRFAWEYKRQGRYKDLTEAYRQLYQYRDALDNPPLSVVCDISTIQIHTHFTGYPRVTETIKLAEIPGKLNVLRRVFEDPESFKRAQTPTDDVTKQVADKFKELADNLIDRLTVPQASFTGEGQALSLIAPGTYHHHDVAHFLMKLIFCLFAEDIGLLPASVFTRLVNRSLQDPDSFAGRATQLFGLMREGGEFGNDRIPWFNGGLFDDKPALPLKHGNLFVLQAIAQKDWGGIEPSIFGTLFERLLDPAKRSQIGAHYTSRDDILLVVEPVVMTPLRREWAAIKTEIEPRVAAYLAETSPKKRAALRDPVHQRINAFRQRLGEVSVLDPACGSGNFLYVALRGLLDLDQEVVSHAVTLGLPMDPLPKVRPTQLHGIEINPYAAELAQVVIWIGYLQWLKEREIEPPHEPILDKLNSIENRDAILDLSDPKNPVPAKWPRADFIVGNPPFLGGSRIWEGLGTPYRDALWQAHDIPRTSDLCCYWFDHAHRTFATCASVRVGLLATQAIRGKQNREVLDRVAAATTIFSAWSDRDWTLDGAAVHVSIVCFGSADGEVRQLNGRNVARINSDLSSELDLTQAMRLAENADLSYIGTKKAGRFNIPYDEARKLLAAPNPHGRGNDEIMSPWASGSSLAGRWDGMWIIDFGVERTLLESSLFEAPFKYAMATVKPDRDTNKRKLYREKWWLHAETRPGLRRSALALSRCIGVTRHSKFLPFAWIQKPFLPDDGVFVFARADDYFLGVLQCGMHELWARRTGTQVREAESGFRYTPTTCFETFPLPWPPGKEKVKHPAYVRIAGAAKALDEQRERWLNPPEWVGPLEARIDAEDDFADVPAEARALVRRSAIMAAAAKDEKLKKRTLTNLYNERPTWLKLAHLALDKAVLSAYSAADPSGEWNEKWAEVWQETGPGQPLPAGHALAARRAEIDRRVLENLLRLNHLRSGQGQEPATSSAAGAGSSPGS